MANEVVLVPLQLQAFVLNPEVCNTGKVDDKGAHIVPITQPNYTFLRLDNFFIQSDVLNHADLHNAAPAATNMRLTDLGARPKPVARRNRYGVYVHWILPQTYRSGVAAADSAPTWRHDEERLKRGLATHDNERSGHVSSSPGQDDGRNRSTPEYLQPPTRWIVIRRLHMDSVEASLRPHFKEYEAWVLESDYKWDLDDIPVDYDLQTDVSPFVVGQKGEGVKIEQQAEVFIGRKTPLADYQPAESQNYTDISLLRSGNLFFADFQLHNSNVFSILDNFEYSDEGDKKKGEGVSKEPGSRKYLNKATADYYLVGWHSSNATDPMWDESRKHTHEDKLRGIFMDLKDTGISETKTFLGSKEPVRMCLHGAMYDVHWDVNKKPESPADKFSAALQDENMPATAVGTSPMDALITYLTARKGAEKDKVIKKLEEDIIAINSLLHARDDGVESQREAEDMAYNWNFSRAQGGKHYFIAGEDTRGKPTQPDPEATKLLNELNQYQKVYDACNRSADQYRWDMFSIWWKYVTDVTNKEDADANRRFAAQTHDLSEKLRKLQARIKDLEGWIENTKKKHTVDSGLLQGLKSSTLPFYSRARDPTMLIGGVDSGWPADFNDNTTVRLAAQVARKGEDGVPQGLKDLASLVTSKFPREGSLKAVSRLLTEFWTLTPANTADDEKAPKGQAFPQFHDNIPTTMDGKLWRDRWENRQPWFPLYAEWEAEYTHVPFEFWELGEQVSRLSAAKKVRYGVPPPSDGTPLWDRMNTGDPKKALDKRILSGRVLILPQPSFSLAAKVKQLFADTPPQILREYLNDEDRQWLLENLPRLSFLSCPLSGFTEGLLTLSAGTHVKPENKYITPAGMEITAAIEAATYEDAGLTKSNIELIANNSAFTPYATQNDYRTAPFCPFKPVTHGQFRFTKFNIIDKFGQALTAIDPKPRKGPRDHPPMYPAISDFYEPQVVKVDGQEVANTVLRNEGKKCEFMQVPPQINQNSRLNADFVIRQERDATPSPTEGGATAEAAEMKGVRHGDSPSYWRPASEWENPIWGWLVINYADQGIQIFLADGTFYREVRIGGRDGATAEPRWLPFAQDAALPKNKENAQLDALVNKMQDPAYLRGLWIMISTAIKNMPASPSTYSQFLGSIVGKPLALVNMGVSLELEGPALESQSTKTGLRSESPEIYLLREDAPEGKHSYELQVKLGDKGREYDGLVGYFDTIEHPTESDRDKELILEYINTYFVNEDESEADHPPDGITNLHLVTTKNYPKLQPFWVPPFPNKGGQYDGPYITPKQYMDDKNRKMKVYGAILDPFTPVHAFSSFLPTKSLQLPPWTWQDSMQNITAFFHAGPLTVTQDVGDYDERYPLTTESMKDAPPRNVALPSLGTGDWNWLQPFDKQQELPLFNAFGIEKKGNIMSPGFEKGPYTALEGFLQLRRPIMVQKPEDDAKKTGTGAVSVQ